jgi:hypothetical protein
MKHFWISHRFIGFVFGKYRDGAGKLVRALNKKGFCVEIHTSRSMSTQRNVVGLICRMFTIMQCWLNGVFIDPHRVHFHCSDEEKISEIIKHKPALVFDDKL